MALKSDAQGFLAGEPIDIGTALGLWRNIGADVRAIRQSLAGNIGRAPVVDHRAASLSAPQQRYEAARAPQRDERGRFVRPGNSPSQVRRPSIPSSSRKADRQIVLATPAAPVKPSGSRLSMPFSMAGMDGVDPTVAAFNEIAQPLARGWEMVGSRGNDDKRQVGLLRRIFGVLNSSKQDDSAFQKAARRSLGVIEGNTEPHTSEGVGGGWIAGLLSKLGLTSLAPILATVGSVLGTLSLAMAPLIAMWKAKNWIEDQKHDTERVDAIKKNAVEPAKEVLKKVGIDKDREIEAIREKNRAEQNGTEEYARMDRAKASFAASEANRAKFEGLKAGSPEFDAKWREASATPGFNKDFEKHYAQIEKKETAPKKGRVSKIWDQWFGAKDDLVSASNKANVDPGVVAKIAAGESAFNPNAMPTRRDGSKISSAHGYGQFIDSTWLQALNTYGDKYGVTGRRGKDGKLNLTKEEAQAYRKNTALQANMLAEHTKDNIALGRKYGGADDAASAYAFHNLGSGDAKKLLQGMKSNPDVSVRDALLAGSNSEKNRKRVEAVIAGNKSLYGNGNIKASDAYKNMGDFLRRGESFAQDARAASVAHAVQPPAQSVVASSPTPSVPKMAAAPVIGDAPPVVAPIGSGGSGGKQTTIIQPKDAGQDLSDRKIAHIVTGGLSSAY